jgi:hypothetical protein
MAILTNKQQNKFKSNFKTQKLRQKCGSGNLAAIKMHFFKAPADPMKMEIIPGKIN